MTIKSRYTYDIIKDCIIVAIIIATLLTVGLLPPSKAIADGASTEAATGR